MGRHWAGSHNHLSGYRGFGIPARCEYFKWPAVDKPETRKHHVHGNIQLTQTSRVQIVVCGPFRQWQPSTRQSNKQEGSSPNDEPAGSSIAASTSGSHAAVPSSSESLKHTSRADTSRLAHTHPRRTSNPTAHPPKANPKHSSPTNARSPPTKSCGFCRSFLGPNAVCLHQGRTHKVVRKSDRLLVRAQNPSAASRRAQSAPGRSGEGPRET
ncbi:hypothetical protein VP1G_04091 [Cytospora mali]|uniref:Uncharacterized protein n=1 Tax=Cytospora mali TaxID=578113 RepID=A0A194UYK6_CYTMA|nr:hypothetical protein VP1G_04091 [Valsa mali var. pyri (nom. inval.)]